jgi:hypothetical protein
MQSYPFCQYFHMRCTPPADATALGVGARPEHPVALMSMSYLAVVLSSQGKYIEEQMHQQTLCHATNNLHISSFI